MTRTFDVAIVGGGSSGCALAWRLARRSKLRIALIEAGPDYGPRANGSWPADIIDAHHSPDSHDWGYDESRARVIGGCSAHNECAIVYALPGDYDRWNVPGWTDAELAPLVKAISRALPTSVPATRDLAAWQRAFLETARAEGFTDVAPFVKNVVKGVRWNAAFAFLDAVRPRVSVISQFVADKLAINSQRAHALLGRGLDGVTEVRADRFVLCAGVFGSPAILLRSGIGAGNQLARLGIRMRISLPGVGGNLHDHPGVAFEYDATAQARRALNDDVRTGRFYEAQVVLKTDPDLHIVPYQAREERQWTFGLLAFHMNPQSRGQMQLSSRDPDAAPKIDLRMLSDAGHRDLAALIHGAQIIHQLTKKPPLAQAIRSGPRRFRSRARLARAVRTNVTSYAHPAGTCRMGSSPVAGDVVDNALQVHGLENVFVADASVMPQSPRANINFTCFVIGIKAADVLVAARRES